VNLDAEFSFSLSQFDEKNCFLGHFERDVLLGWGAWSHCRHLQVSLSSKNFCLQSSRLMVEYKAALFTSEDAKTHSKNIVITLNCRDQAFVSVKTDMTIFECY